MASLWDISWSLLLLVLSIPVAQVVRFIIKKVGGHFASKTATMVDDQIIRITAHVVYYLIILGFLYFAILPFVPPEYMEEFHRAMVVVCVLVGGYVAKKIISDVILVEYMERILIEESHKSVFSTIKGMVDVILYIIIITVALSALGIDTSSIITALGVGGVAVALAVKDPLSQFIAGVHIVLEKKVEVGRRIKVGSYEGVVREVKWRHVSLEDDEGNIIVVPNTTVANSPVIIYKAKKT